MALRWHPATRNPGRKGKPGKDSWPIALRRTGKARWIRLRSHGARKSSQEKVRWVPESRHGPCPDCRSYKTPNIRLDRVVGKLWARQRNQRWLAKYSTSYHHRVPTEPLRT